MALVWLHEQQVNAAEIRRHFLHFTCLKRTVRHVTHYEYFNTLVFGACVDAAWLSSLMDPCSLSDICDSCHRLATCTALNGSNHACFCNHGYTGDGTTFCNGEYKHTKPPICYSVFATMQAYNQPRLFGAVVCNCLSLISFKFCNGEPQNITHVPDYVQGCLSQRVAFLSPQMQRGIINISDFYVGGNFIFTN